MSSIDNRIVRMEFQNKGFQKGIANTLKSLEALKSGLNQNLSTKSFGDLQGAANKFNTTGMQRALDNVSVKFGALATVGITALANLTNKAVDAGIAFGKSLTVDAKKAGFDEYELKMGAIQTIMAGTGADLEDVNAKLNDLNTYADDTIYNFADMTSNIGKFTNAGVGLDDSVAAIQGVANVAAISGANSNDASRAMYNFSQALSQGSVRLQDWMSIENANMATAEFREELIKSAVSAGTLTKAGDGLWKTMDGTEVTVENFRNTLQDQWLTSEALTDSLGRYADKNTEIGARATAAATEVKTFTQLIDTMKEAAGSGWAQSFEFIIGDFEEAKDMFSGISKVADDILGGMADRRNARLKGWKEMGGRDEVIEGFKNIWAAINSFVAPIAEVWNKVFPPSTGKNLYAISVAFRKLTEGFKIGEVAGKAIGKVFEVFFTMLKGGLGILKGIGGLFLNFFTTLKEGFANLPTQGLATLIKTISSLVGGFLEWLNIGDRIASFFQMFEGWQTAALLPMIQIIDNIAMALNQLLLGDLDGFSDYMAKAFSGLDGPLEAVRGIFKDVFGSIEDGLDGIVDKFKELGGPVFAPLATAIGWISDRIGELKDSLGSFKFDFDLGGLSGGSDAGGGLIAAGERVSEAWESVKDSMQSVADFFGPIMDRLTEFLSNMSSKILGWFENMTMGEAVSLLNTGMFIAAYLAIKKVFDKLDGLLDTFDGFFEGVKETWESVRGVFLELKDTLKLMQTDIKANIILKIAAAVGVLALSMWVLAQLDTNQLIKSITALGVLFGLLVGALAAINKMDLSEQSGLMKTSAALILMSVALVILAQAVKSMGQLSLEELAKGLGAVAILLAALTLFTKFSEADGAGLSSGVGLLLLAIAINLLVKAVEKLGQMDTGELQKGLLALGAIIVGLTAISAVMSKAGNMVGAATGLLIMAAALFVIYKAIQLYSGMEYGEFFKGLGLIAAAVVALGLAMRAFPEKSAIAGAVAMGIMAIALWGIVQVLKDIASMDVEEMIKAGAGLAAILILVAGAALVMSKAVAGAAAMIIMAAAIGIIALVLITLAAVPWDTLLIATGILAGLIVVLALIGTLAATPILALGIALGILGVALLAAGAGFFLFATGFATFAAVGAAGVAVLIAIFEGLISLIPLFMEQIALGFIAFAKVISDAGPVIIDALVTILMSLLEAIRTVIPEAVSVMGSLILALIAEVRRLVPQIVALIIDMLIDTINAINARVGEFVTAASNLLINFLAGLEEEVPNIIAAVTDLIIAMIDEISNSITKFSNAAAELILEFLDGIERKIPVIIRKARRVIKVFVDEMATAVEEDIPWIVGRVKDMAWNMIDGMIGELVSWEALGKVKDAAIDFVSAGWNAALDWLGINSPSRKWMELGLGSAEGMTKGLADNVGMVTKQSEKTAIAATDVMRKTLGDVSKLVSGDLDMAPHIKPVLDLSDVEHEAKKLGGMLRQNDVMPNFERSNLRAATVRNNWDKNRGVPLEELIGDLYSETKNEIHYEQNNYSPKALSTIEIYRQTNSQISNLRKEIR